MDDFVAALLCLPFLILPSMVLVAIISSKIKASEMVKKICVAIRGAPVEVTEIKPLRFAEATGTFDKALQMLSQVGLPRETATKS